MVLQFCRVMRKIGAPVPVSPHGNLLQKTVQEVEETEIGVCDPIRMGNLEREQE
jgi:hypothetical protein